VSVLPGSNEVRLGRIIRERRCQLNLTQRELASRVKTSAGYIALLESGKRHPSQELVVDLANALGLERSELFFLEHPRARAILNPTPGRQMRSAWEQFKQDHQLQRLHRISDDEMELLSSVALLGEVRSPREFIYILTVVRHAMGR